MLTMYLWKAKWSGF